MILKQVTRQINEMTRNVTELEKAIADKEGYMALAHTRLGKRAHRPQVELVRSDGTKYNTKIDNFSKYTKKLSDGRKADNTI